MCKQNACNNAMFQENKGLTCSSIYVGPSECSSIDLEMDKVTIAGGICSIKDISSKRGEVLVLYRRSADPQPILQPVTHI